MCRYRNSGYRYSRWLRGSWQLSRLTSSGNPRRRTCRWARSWVWSGEKSWVTSGISGREGRRRVSGWAIGRESSGKETWVRSGFCGREERRRVRGWANRWAWRRDESRSSSGYD